MQIVDAGNAVHVTGAPPLVEQTIRQNLTLPNPAYVGAVRAGKTPYGIPKVLHYHDEVGDGLVIPAAADGIAYAAADAHGVAVDRVASYGRVLPTIDLHFLGSLRLYQTVAVAQIIGQQRAIVEAPTGSGKTVISCAAIVERRQPALIVVHSSLLLEQWADALAEYTDATCCLVGGGHQYSPGADVTIAIVNSLSKVVDEVDQHVGHLVVDECHRAAAKNYWSTIGRITARHRLGLSATPYRRDGLTDAIQWALGPIITVDRAPLVVGGAVLPADVEQRSTDFASDIDGSEHYQALIDELVHDGARNGQIVSDAIAEAARGVVLVLSDRKDHARHLAARIPGSALLVGGQGKGARRDELAAISDGSARVICATTQLVGEGFDLPEIGAIMLTTPTKWRGRLLQAIGRALRPAHGKTSGKIIDYADNAVPVLRASARARAREYRRLAKDEIG